MVLKEGWVGFRRVRVGVERGLRWVPTDEGGVKKGMRMGRGLREGWGWVMGVERGVGWVPVGYGRGWEGWDGVVLVRVRGWEGGDVGTWRWGVGVDTGVGCFGLEKVKGVVCFLRTLGFHCMWTCGDGWLRFMLGRASWCEVRGVYVARGCRCSGAETLLLGDEVGGLIQNNECTWPSNWLRHTTLTH